MTVTDSESRIRQAAIDVLDGDTLDVKGALLLDAVARSVSARVGQTVPPDPLRTILAPDVEKGRVQVGSIVDGKLAEIVEPAKLDGPVVTMGHHLLEDGGAVRLPESKPTPKGGRP